MKCTNCGNRLSPGSSVCGVCGAPTVAQMPPAQGLQGSPPGTEGTQPGNGSASRPHRPQTAFYGRYGTRGNAVLPAPSSLAIPTPSASSEGTASATSPILTVDPITEPVPPNPTSTPTPPVPDVKPTRTLITTHLARPRRSLAGQLIALGGIVIVLALLVSLSAFGYNAYKKTVSDTRAAAAANARSNATATAAAQATATASTPLFTDMLASNANGWMEDGTTAFFSDGQYHLHNPDPTTTLNSYYQQQVFDNFKVQVTVTADTDANPNADVPYAYGLILRADPNTPTNKYVFFVSPAGTYDFARHDTDGFFNNGWSDLTSTPWTSSSAIHTGKGATNTLTVIADANNFTLVINGQVVETVTDTFGGFGSGWIGLMVEGADMEASFSNLQVYASGA